MTTDITELAQREKFDAWFKSSFHPDQTGPYIKDQLFFAWKAAGTELVEALEKAQQKVDVYDMLREDYGLCEKGVGLADFVDWQNKRIASLESRTVTVKLPKNEIGEAAEFGGCAVVIPVSVVAGVCAAAGIQVIEGEG